MWRYGGMSDETQRISVKGRQRVVTSIPVGAEASVIVTGSIIKIGKIHDEYWLEAKNIPEPELIVNVLKNSSARPDLFTFAQKLPNVTPRYNYQMEWDNYAVANFESYADWFEKQIDRNTKKNIRKFTKEGVTVDVVPFTDELVEGMCPIYNELKVRQGREFWHYGKDFATIKNENSSYLERSVFIGTHYKEELIGFIKIVFVDNVACLMQILSKASYHEKRPTNALLSKAVEVCESKGIKYLTYGDYVYGKKDESSLIEFKRKNGFKRIDIPRYYVPLTAKGYLALKYGVYKDWKDLLPIRVVKILVDWRAKYYSRQGHDSKDSKKS
jgi:hypothetical protein